MEGQSEVAFCATRRSDEKSKIAGLECCRTEGMWRRPRRSHPSMHMGRGGLAWLYSQRRRMVAAFRGGLATTETDVIVARRWIVFFRTRHCGERTVVVVTRTGG